MKHGQANIRTYSNCYIKKSLFIENKKGIIFLYKNQYCRLYHLNVMLVQRQSEEFSKRTNFQVYTFAKLKEESGLSITRE